MFKIIDNRLGRPQVTVQQTTADWLKFLGRDGQSGTPPMMRPGTRVRAYDEVFGEAEFILAYGVASNDIGKAVIIGAGYAVSLTVAASRGTLAVSMSANTDTAALSWYCIFGQVPVKAATMAVTSPLYSTATGGSLSSTAVANSAIAGATSVLAASGTVTTKTIQTVNGSDLILVPDTGGIYVGEAITGTGIPGSTTIAAVAEGGKFLGATSPATGHHVVQLSAAATATGSVTGTFAHSSTFGTASLAYPSMGALA